MAFFVRVLFALGALMLTAAADAPVLTALAKIEPGQWTLRSADGHTPPRTMCVADPRILLQLQHSGVACSRFVIENEPGVTTVHYTCPSAGHGRTTVRVETPRLIHVDSQGISGGAPFDWSFEGRKSGTCAGTAAR